jgi:hypothetical protein
MTRRVDPNALVINSRQEDNTNSLRQTFALYCPSVTVITEVTGLVAIIVGVAGLLKLPFAITGASRSMNIGLVAAGVFLDLLPVFLEALSQAKEAKIQYSSLKTIAKDNIHHHHPVSLEGDIKANEKAELSKDEKRDEALKQARDNVLKADAGAELEQEDTSSLAYDASLDQLARNVLGLSEEEYNLHHYFENKTHFNSFINAADTDQVSSSGIVKASQLTDKHFKEINKQIFKHILAKTYSDRLANLVWEKYQFDKADGLTVGLIKQALVGIAASVGDNHLKMLFSGIRHACKKDSLEHVKVMHSYQYLKTLNPNLLEEISQVESFDELSPEHVEFLMLAFRTLPLKENNSIKPERILNVLYPNKSLETALADNSEAYLFLHDVELLKVLSRCSQLTLAGQDAIGTSKEQHKQAVLEYIAKTIPYNQWTPGMVFSIPDINNKQHFYVVEASSNEAGLVATFSVPLNKKQNPFPSERPQIFFQFQGTNSYIQWRRNIDYTGVGRTEFEKQSKKLLNILVSYLKKETTRSIDLHIGGHSLGGADSKRFGNLVTEAVASDKNGTFDKVKSIEITTYNAPMLEQSLNFRFKKAVASLHAKTKPPSIKLNYVRFENDVVQDCGDVSPGSDWDGYPIEVNGKKMNNLFFETPFFERKITIIDFEEDKDKTFLGLHSTRIFDPLSGPPIKWKVNKQLDGKNQTSIEQVERILAGRYYYNDNTDSLLNKVRRVATYPSELTFNLIHRCLHYTLYLPLSW